MKTVIQVEKEQPITTRCDGMTLRDYFAAKAMQGLSENRLLDYDTISRRAYEIANAMLKQRELLP